VIATFVSVDKVVKEERNVTLLQITAVAKLVRDFLLDVPRPALCGIEGNNPDWVFILAGEQTNRHRFQISGLEVGTLARRGQPVRDHPLPSKPYDRDHSGQSTGSNSDP
jgi:hypothetical protein